MRRPADGRPLSDHLRLDLDAGGRAGFAALLATTAGLVGLRPARRGQRRDAASRSSSTPDAGDDADARPRRSLAAALDVVAGTAAAASTGGCSVPTTPTTSGRALGLATGRTLLPDAAPLPTGLSRRVATRPFVAGDDEEAWLAVNNRAFAGHPEQGGWTADDLHQREGEPWFDPDGFLLHERDGRLAAFCWTKLHHGDGRTRRSARST